MCRRFWTVTERLWTTKRHTYISESYYQQLLGWSTNLVGVRGGVKFSDDEDLIFFLTLQFQKENEILIVRKLDCLIWASVLFALSLAFGLLQLACLHFSARPSLVLKVPRFAIFAFIPPLTSKAAKAPICQTSKRKENSWRFLFFLKFDITVINPFFSTPHHSLQFSFLLFNCSLGLFL